MHFAPFLSLINSSINFIILIGCVKLQRLYIFECPFHPSEVAKVIVRLPDLTDLGYNETGKVVKCIAKKSQVRKFEQVHVCHIRSDL